MKNFLVEKIIEFGDKKIFIIYGYMYFVKLIYDFIVNYVKVFRVDVCFFGYIYQQEEFYLDSIFFLNLGSLVFLRDGLRLFVIVEVIFYGVVVYLEKV